jgi:hypothetical protein
VVFSSLSDANLTTTFNREKLASKKFSLRLASILAPMKISFWHPALHSLPSLLLGNLLHFGTFFSLLYGSVAQSVEQSRGRGIGPGFRNKFIKTNIL